MNFTDVQVSTASGSTSVSMAGKNVLIFRGTNTPTLTLTGLVDGQMILVVNTQIDAAVIVAISPCASAASTVSKGDAAIFYYTTENGVNTLYRVTGDEY